MARRILSLLTQNTEEDPSEPDPSAPKGKYGESLMMKVYILKILNICIAADNLVFFKDSHSISLLHLHGNRGATAMETVGHIVEQFSTVEGSFDIGYFR